MGYGYIAEELAPRINQFCVDYLNIYLNYHRPCGYRIEKRKSEISKRIYYKYGDYQTPYQRFKNMENAEMYLKEGVTFEQLDKIEKEHSDNDFAEILSREKQKLFKEINQNRTEVIQIPESKNF